MDVLSQIFGQQTNVLLKSGFHKELQTSETHFVRDYLDPLRLLLHRIRFDEEQLQEFSLPFLIVPGQLFSLGFLVSCFLREKKGVVTKAYFHAETITDEFEHPRAFYIACGAHSGENGMPFRMTDGEGEYRELTLREGLMFLLYKNNFSAFASKYLIFRGSRIGDKDSAPCLSPGPRLNTWELLGVPSNEDHSAGWYPNVFSRLCF